MLKKKILGAKVLDTNGYVQATRLITPTNLESEAAEIKRLFNQGSSKPSHQLGDIYNANMVDIVAKAVSQGDAQLNDQVNAETAARKEEDNKLSERINQEIKDRKQAIVDLVNGAPEAFDTLKEISDYIASDKDFASAIVNSLSKETQRATNAENTIKTDLETEIDRAKTRELSISDAVVKETKDRTDAINALRKEINDLVSNIESSIISKSNAIMSAAIVSMQSSTYNKDTNILTQTFVRGDGSTLQYNTDLTSMIDSNDIKNSESTTMNYSNGKISTSVNTIGVDDVDTLFNN